MIHTFVKDLTLRVVKSCQFSNSTVFPIHQFSPSHLYHASLIPHYLLPERSAPAFLLASLPPCSAFEIIPHNAAGLISFKYIAQIMSFFGSETFCDFFPLSMKLRGYSFGFLSGKAPPPCGCPLFLHFLPQLTFTHWTFQQVGYHELAPYFVVFLCSFLLVLQLECYFS